MWTVRSPTCPSDDSEHCTQDQGESLVDTGASLEERVHIGLSIVFPLFSNVTCRDVVALRFDQAVEIFIVTQRSPRGCTKWYIMYTLTSETSDLRRTNLSLRFAGSGVILTKHVFERRSTDRLSKTCFLDRSLARSSIPKDTNLRKLHRVLEP
jgi:hypothetical protein